MGDKASEPNPSSSTNRFAIENRGGQTVLICNGCQLPCLDIQNGLLRIQSKHGNAKHENFLTIEHLKMLAVAMYAQLHPPRPPEQW